jgi:hypothetical protein
MSGSLGGGSSSNSSLNFNSSQGSGQTASNNWNQSTQGSGNNAWNQSGNQATNLSSNQATSGQNVWGNQSGQLDALYAAAGGLLNGSSPQGQQAQQIGNQGAQAWAQQLTPGANPYFDQAVQASIDQATDSFKRGTLADLDARSAGVGQLGSSRDRLATGEAAGLFGQSIAQTAAQQRAQQYSADQDRSLQAIGMTGNMQQGAYSPLSVAASLIGGPTVLSNSQSSGYGTGQSTGFGSGASSGWGYGQSSGGGNSYGTTNQSSFGVGSGAGSAWNANTSGGIKSS